jgi:CIC family chloride channel protein
VTGSEPPLLLVLGIFVGLLSGLGAALFRWLIQEFHGLFFEGGRHVLGFLGPYYTIPLPAVGGLLVGLLIYYGAREAKGHGVPEILEAISVRGGTIRSRVAVVKSLASALTIGSGGSSGREGPIAQIGAALGSGLGQLLHLPRNATTTLLACGAAGGIAATFNAPLAGTFFAMEIVLAAWRAEYFAPIVGASVAASVVGYVFFGNTPAFKIPDYSINAYHDLPWFILLGGLAALAGVGFLRLIYLCEDSFARLRGAPWLMPAVGGLAVGVLGLYNPEIYGVGYGAISNALVAFHYTIGVLLALLVLKTVATGLTLGSGGSGGIFVPAMFVGAMLGAALGQGLHGWFPGLDVSPGAFALVGMAAVFAAASHAPITSVLIVFELTRDYRMILPLMLACGVSVILAKMIFRYSIYNLKLIRRGIHISLREDTRLLDDIAVEEAMTTEVVTVLPETPVREVQRLFEHTKHHGFPLVDAAGRLHGIVTIGDLRDVAPAVGDEPVSARASHDLVVAYPDETLNEALLKLGLRKLGRLPVVEREDVTHMVGLITRKNLIGAYNRALAAAHTHLDGSVEQTHFE